MRTKLLAILMLAVASPTLAQTEARVDAGPLVKSDSIPLLDTVVAGNYGAGTIHRWVLGTQYRDLWTTPIEVPVLDLSTYAGGLTPNKKSGSRQTIGLRFKAKNGIEYNFRSVDKYPSRALPSPLKKGLVERIFKDQMSAQYPAAAVIVSSLLDAAGVLHAHPQLYVMPDDPRLGEFRQEFAGMLGTIEERDLQLPGVRQVVETQELFDSLRTDPGHKVDGVDYLKARLMDIFIGDWDRHSDQWGWAAFSSGPGKVTWRSVPKDRDWAFAKMDGPIAMLVRQYFPQTIGFDKNYPPLLDLTWTARDLDRRLLSELERSVWDSVVADLQGRLSDSAISVAIRNQPVEFQQKEGAWLETALKNRRDHLPKAASDFYRLLVEAVDVHATDAAEMVQVEHQDDGSVDLTVRTVDPGLARPTFARRFLPKETREVRVYLHGGEDVATVTGKRGVIKVRVIGEPDDRLIDSSHTGASFYPDRIGRPVEPEKADATANKKTVDAEHGPSVPEVMASESFGPPPRAADFLKTYPLDWGRRWVSLPWVEYHPGPGIELGLEANHYVYGFRADPYRKRLKIKGGWGFAGRGPKLEAYAEDRELLPFTDRFHLGGRVDLKFSKIETARFYGWGNETTLTSPKNAARMLEDIYSISPSLFYLGPRLHASIGPMLQLTDPHNIPGSRLDLIMPLGTDRLVLAGVKASAGWNVGVPIGRGIGGRLRLDTRIARSVTATEAHFVHSGAEAVGYVVIPMPLHPSFAVRAGAEKAWGLYPFQEAALLGGQRNLRGFDKDRFAGNANAYVGTDLRVPFLRRKSTQFGVMGVADMGRVFLDGESSSTWHRGYGGGLWGGVPGGLVVDVIVAHGERLVLNFYTGFGF